jgi:4a-hydroxytetrahydrobiopterin dehydratase
MSGGLSRGEISAAVGGYGWRFVLGVLQTRIRVASLEQAAGLAARVVAECGADADGHLRVDLRPGHVVFSLESAATAWVTPPDIDLAHRISAVAAALGLVTDAGAGTASPRSVQQIEIAVDAMDIAAVRPFWRAVLGYGDEADRTGPTDPVVDPLRQGPAVWFQQMDAPRPQRNRIHIDISVPHDEAPHRLAAALAAGGTMRSDASAPAFWVLADPEGNEACITTWQGRDG